MKIALLIGLTGASLCVAVGAKILEFGPVECLLCIAISTVAGLLALLATLQAERQQWISTRVLNRTSKTWACLILLYFSFLLAFFPPLRSFRALLYLVIPLALSTGLSIVVFGPIQDQIVRRRQRRFLDSTGESGVDSSLDYID